MSRGGSSFSSPRFSRVRLARGVLLVAALLILALPSSAPADQLTLTNGTSMTVADLQVRGSMVQVRLPDGRLRAFPLADVDLTASGLARPHTVVQTPQPESLGSLGSPTADGASPGFARITDADVNHVVPGSGGGATSGGSSGAGAPGGVLRVSQVREAGNPQHSVISGVITNTGATTVRGISVSGTARAGDDHELGHATVALGRPLAPGESYSFEIPMRVAAPPASVHVLVHSQAATVLFASP